MQSKISAALIVKNEEDRIEDALKSVTWADEIVVLDAGSTDQTVAIAQKYTDQVHVRADWEGFGAQRDRLHQLCSGDWILMIDADERVSDSLAKELAALRGQPLNNAYEVYWPEYAFGKLLKHGGWSSYKLSMYPRERGRWDVSIKLHERLMLDADININRLEPPLHHYSIRNLEHYLTKNAHYATIFAETAFAQGKTSSLGNAFLHAWANFIKRYFIKAGFLDGRYGLFMAGLSAHSCYIKYAALWIKSVK